tara:strand:+ start:15223 stop:16008 length:786 start_codon:yes stop_codon:yes gene_type:complete
MKISVICPTYNSSKFIQTTLESILKQIRMPDELIISDDGSTDNTLDVIEDYLRSHCKKLNYKIVKNSHKGPGAARNSGIRSSTCKWIAFLDSDDIWYPNKISHIHEIMSENEDVNFICHNEIHVSKGKNKHAVDYSKKFKADRPLFEQLYISNLFSTSAVVCKKDLLINHGMFDESLMSAQDYDLWLRLAPNIRVHFVKKILGEYTIRSGNITSSSIINRFRNEIKIARKYSRSFKPQKFVIRIIIIILSYIKQLILKYIR